jgi:hypothetical protein
MRRTHLRGHQNILKRLLIHVGPFSLSLIFRSLLGSGTPRKWKNRQSSLLFVLLLLFHRYSALKSRKLQRHMRAKVHRVHAIFLFLFLSLVSGLVPSAFCWTTYITNFSLTENPISENGKWIDRKAVGLDWANVRTSPGLAYGTQTDTIQYDDSTAVLTGTWGQDQSAWAKVHTVNQTSALVEEVEIRLRTTISAHRITGYEINFRCTADGSQYVQIVRWNGPLGDFTLIDSRPGPGLHNGDVVKAAVSGSTIIAYVNGNAIFSATDTRYRTLHPVSSPPLIIKFQE